MCYRNVVIQLLLGLKGCRDFMLLQKKRNLERNNTGTPVHSVAYTKVKPTLDQKIIPSERIKKWATGRRSGVLGQDYNPSREREPPISVRWNKENNDNL